MIRHCVLVGLFLAPALLFGGRSEIYSSGKFDVLVTRVRSLGPETRVGFSKSIAAYAVDAQAGNRRFVAYCTKRWPISGLTYHATLSFVSGDYSYLHLWPVEHDDPQLPDDARKRKGRLYQMIIFYDSSPGSKSDIACDLYSDSGIER